MPVRRKCIALGIIFGLVIIIALCSLFALIMSFTDLPNFIISAISFLIISLACYFSAYFSTQIYRKNGLFQGLMCGLGVFALLFIISLLGHKSQLSTMVFVKLLLCIVFGAIGGIKGVNTRKTKAR